jgi:hypothetical protein
MQEAGRERNPNIDLGSLVEVLLDPVSRKARRTALVAASRMTTPTKRRTGGQPQDVVARQRQNGRRSAYGEVQQAVVRALGANDGPMRVPDVHAAVEGLLGRSVPKNSIYWCLSASAGGRRGRIQRVSTGCYRLSD